MNLTIHALVEQHEFDFGQIGPIAKVARGKQDPRNSSAGGRTGLGVTSMETFGLSVTVPRLDMTPKENSGLGAAAPMVQLWFSVLESGRQLGLLRRLSIDGNCWDEGFWPR